MSLAFQNSILWPPINGKAEIAVCGTGFRTGEPRLLPNISHPQKSSQSHPMNQKKGALHVTWAQSRCRRKEGRRT